MKLTYTRPDATPADIVHATNAVAAAFRCNASSIMSRRRAVHDTRPRFALYLLLSEFNDGSVARLLGRCRSNITRCRAAARNWVDTDPDMNYKYNKSVTNQINASLKSL